jgi:hypothetical protein
MDTSIFIAQLLGPPILLAGLSLIAHQSFYGGVAESVRNSPGLLYMMGMLRLLAGLAIVLVHNVWTWDWRVIITLMGWIALLRGVLILAAPEAVIGMTRRFLERDGMIPLLAAAAIVLGGALCFFGYV